MFAGHAAFELRRPTCAAVRTVSDELCTVDKTGVPDTSDTPVDQLECQLCHRPTERPKLVIFSGRLLCLDCANAWFDGDDEDDEEEQSA